MTLLLCMCVCVTGANYSHSRFRRWFPRYGRLLRCDEGPVWVRGPGLCHVCRWSLRIHLVSFIFDVLSSSPPYTFTPALPLSPPTYSVKGTVVLTVSERCSRLYLHCGWNDRVLNVLSFLNLNGLSSSLFNNIWLSSAFPCWYEAVIMQTLLACFSLHLYVCGLHFGMKVQYT